MASRALTRGGLAKLTGCNIETIRYYEKVGLLPEPPRSESGYRQYSEVHTKRLGFILKAKVLGFNSESIRNLLTISDGGDDCTRAQAKSLTETHIKEIANKIKDLQKLKKRLEEISSHCDGAEASATECPIITTLFTVDD